MPQSLRLTYLGHSCFKIESSKGSLVCDPYDPSVGYDRIFVSANLVTKSHDHRDHNYLEGVNIIPSDDPGFNLIPIKTWHDDENGEKRGENTVYVFESDGLRVCHLGDLGHELSDEQIKEIGKIDALLLPVGGTYTVTGAQAAKIAMRINPKIVIPMHFKNNVCTLPLSDETEFLKSIAGYYNIHYYPSRSFILSKDTERGVYILLFK